MRYAWSHVTVVAIRRQRGAAGCAVAADEISLTGRRLPVSPRGLGNRSTPRAPPPIARSLMKRTTLATSLEAGGGTCARARERLHGDGRRGPHDREPRPLLDDPEARVCALHGSERRHGRWSSRLRAAGHVRMQRRHRAPANSAGQPHHARRLSLREWGERALPERRLSPRGARPFDVRAARRSGVSVRVLHLAGCDRCVAALHAPRVFESHHDGRRCSARRPELSDPRRDVDRSRRSSGGGRGRRGSAAADQLPEPERRLSRMHEPRASATRRATPRPGSRPATSPREPWRSPC